MRNRAIQGRSKAGVAAFLGIGLVVLPILLSSAVFDGRNASLSADRSLAFEASRQAAMVDDYFERSRSLTQILAANPSFAEFYRSPGDRVARIRGGGKVVRDANEALVHLERLFPGSIGESCFIDAGGAENARAVKGRIEPIDRLSKDERSAGFFRATFDLAPGSVYQSPPYVSPDTDEWVIANSAPIEVAGRSAPAIVHFEVTLESLRLAAATLGPDVDVQIVDSRTGAVVVDTRNPLAGDVKAGRLPGTAAVRLGGQSSGVVTLDGRRSAFERIPPGGENANDWTVVVISRAPVPGWLDSVGPLEWILILGVALALPLALLSWRQSQADLDRAAHTDGLTGLGNRRSLVEELAVAVRHASAERPVVLVLFDLDGFKHYNDTFGHPAGDALLLRLARALAECLPAGARAFRMGGDEFCVVARLAQPGDALVVVAEASRALEERGDGFEVSASHGAVLLPVETGDADEAMRIADVRMYACKGGSRLSAPRQATDVLVRILGERNAELEGHSSEVASLASAVASRLGLPANRVAETERAAVLHDIGKLAIPESILDKLGGLTEAESQFVNQHTLIGERILAAAPSLEACSSIVRSSHERWDGKGFPDGLRGEAIPLEARIIAVCDAYDAMVADRPPVAPLGADEAVAELRRLAGSQFDPRVVEAFAVEARLRSPVNAAGHTGDTATD
jgi:diguanylate cyclase (GGDEF)-like protein